MAGERGEERRVEAEDAEKKGEEEGGGSQGELIGKGRFLSGGNADGLDQIDEDGSEGGGGAGEVGVGRDGARAGACETTVCQRGILKDGQWHAAVPIGPK